MMNPSDSSMEAEVSMEKQAIELSDPPPFHILFLGDFEGENGGGSSIPKPIEIDRDNFEELMAVTAPGISINAGDDRALKLRFRSLDDFHPDVLFQNISLFDELRSLRERLLDERAFANAAKEVRAWFGIDKDIVEESDGELEVEGTDGLLDDILGSKDRDVTAYKPSKSAELSDFVKKIVDPHLVRVDENEQARLIEAVDQATGGLMKAIIGDSGFKRLESIWRGLYFTCRNADTDSKLKLFFASQSKEKFVSALKSGDGDGVAETILSGRNGEPWALVCGAFDFAANVEDVAALMRVAGISGVINAPFVSHVRPDMLGIRSFDLSPSPSDWDVVSQTAEGKLWTVLRGAPDAEFLGLIVPRLLSRLPYGVDTDPTETFDFEERDDEFNHDSYLWMNPVFGFAVSMARSFSKSGWEMGGRYELDLSGLPMDVYKENGATVTKPCAEFEMTDNGLEILLEQGVIPFASFRGTDRVRVGGVQSVKFPNKALKGRWS